MQTDQMRIEIIRTLKLERTYLVKNEIADTDVRIIIHDTTGPIWEIAFGDVSYDLFHGIACGASTIGPDDTDDGLRETADDLIAQVVDQLACDVESPATRKHDA